ncbi:DMT family transporter [Alloiococcus sp. CFN-8]|uniref:DMT family transporter n=1 Tax=Alloiococcus sp. CFN-8 TaxID=3416081 RepID=UPI003CE86CAE
MILNIIFYLLFTVGGLIFIKLGSEGLSFSFKAPQLNLSMNYYLVLGLIFYVISFALWTVLLRGNKLSYIVPLTTGLSQVLIVFSSAIIFHERITPLKIIAVGIIILGVVLLNLQK